MDIARHVIDAIFEPSFFIQMASYDVASDICQTHCPPHFEPTPFLLSGVPMTWRAPSVWHYFPELASAGAQSILPLVTASPASVPVLEGVIIPSPLILGNSNEVKISVDRASGVVDVFTASASGNATHTSARLGGVVVQVGPGRYFPPRHRHTL